MSPDRHERRGKEHPPQDPGGEAYDKARRCRRGARKVRNVEYVMVGIGRVDGMGYGAEERGGVLRNSLEIR